MLDEVKRCVDAKINFFAEYFSVPGELEESVTKFADDTASLGETCNSAVEFEEKFVSSGLAECFNALIPKCTPKARKMTKEEKQNAAKTAREILSDNKKELAQDAVQKIASNAASKQRDKLLNESRERMIANGTYAENTIRRNNMETAGEVGRFLVNIFRKK